MTLEEIRNEIWKATGELTDLDPSTDTSYNGGPYLNFVIKMAQDRIASYKTMRGRILRFNHLIGEMFHKEAPISATLASDGTTSTIVLPSTSFDGNDDQYNGWIVKSGGEYRLIMDYVGSTYTATLNDDLSTAPAAGDEITVYKRFAYLLPSVHPWAADHIVLPSTTDKYRADGNLFEILNIDDINENTHLAHSQKGKTFVTQLTTIGDPTSWYRFGNKIYFDSAPDEAKWFRLEYYRMPLEMTLDADEPDLPEPFHYAIVLWGIEWVYRREGESSEKYSTKRDFVEFMEQTLMAVDVQDERNFTRGVLRLK